MLPAKPADPPEVVSASAAQAPLLHASGSKYVFMLILIHIDLHWCIFMDIVSLNYIAL